MIFYLKNKFKNLLVKLLLSILRNPSVTSTLWEITNRPLAHQIDREKPIVPNTWLQLWNYAGWETAKYIAHNMIAVPAYNSTWDLLVTALSKSKSDGLYLEFGSGYEAKSINFIAEKIDTVVHGFDSFEGLPEDWFGHLGKGSLTTDGKLPNVRENVRLHVGLFENTLPEFIREYSEEAAFIHVDCDLYCSTKTVFDYLADRIVSGTVIQFDEYFNYPGWEKHEFKAFQEFIKKTGMEYEYIGYSMFFAVAVIIK